LRQQLTEAMGTSAEPVLSNARRPRQLGQVYVDLELAAPESTARSMKRNCCHHWVIEVAIAPLSKGTCKRCGEEKVFRNQLQWDEIAPVKAMNGRRSAGEERTLEQRQGSFLLKRSRYEGQVAV
jgi:hypothetical protein